jgi:serine protease inhibitor
MNATRRCRHVVPPSRGIFLRQHPICLVLAIVLLPACCIPGFPVQTNSVSASFNRFGFELFRQLRVASSQIDANIFISPLSVGMVLSMVYNGAANETARAFSSVLHFDGKTPDQINREILELRQQLKSHDPGLELLVANSLWYRQNVKFEESFLARNREFFDAEIAPLDFGSPQALSRINGWVSTNTKGKIPKIVDQIGRDHVMFLINAVYFKGQWKNKFDPTNTKNEDFHLANGSKKQVPMMARAGSYVYRRGERFEVVTLPYAGDKVAMTVVLPEKGLPLTELLKQLDAGKWDDLFQRSSSSPGSVKLPRFKLTYESKLNDALKALGLGVAFDGAKADFTGMRKVRDLVISEVKHKTFVEVNEEGTTAAAATSAAIGVTSVRQQPFEFVADRPFLVVLRNVGTASVLFVGAINNP